MKRKGLDSDTETWIIYHCSVVLGEMLDHTNLKYKLVGKIFFKSFKENLNNWELLREGKGLKEYVLTGK